MRHMPYTLHTYHSMPSFLKGRVNFLLKIKSTCISLIAESSDEKDTHSIYRKWKGIFFGHFFEKSLNSLVKWKNILHPTIFAYLSMTDGCAQVLLFTVEFGITFAKDFFNNNWKKNDIWCGCIPKIFCISILFHHFIHGNLSFSS